MTEAANIDKTEDERQAVIDYWREVHARNAPAFERAKAKWDAEAPARLLAAAAETARKAAEYMHARVNLETRLLNRPQVKGNPEREAYAREAMRSVGGQLAFEHLSRHSYKTLRRVKEIEVQSLGYNNSPDVLARDGLSRQNKEYYTAVWLYALRPDLVPELPLCFGGTAEPGLMEAWDKAYGSWWLDEYAKDPKFLERDKYDYDKTPFVALTRIEAEVTGGTYVPIAFKFPKRAA